MKERIFIALLVLGIMSVSAFNLDCYYFQNADNPLLIPTYIDDNDETCHPDVLFFADGWNGWRYWMSHTPYPNTNVAYENPSIVVSNDGLTWIEPEGISNPIADVYQGTDMNNNYNSDSHLFMSPDQTTMHLIWRRKNGWNNELTYMKSSTDGINWSATSTVLSVYATTPELNESILSPCMLHNGKGYVIWTVNTKVTPRSIYMRYKPTLDMPWSEPILTDIGDFPDGYRVWHMDIEYIDGYYHMLASVGISTTQEGRVLYLGKSLDGVHWTFSSQPVMIGQQGNWDARIYRSAFIRDESGLGYKNWYGSMNHPQWRIGYSEAEVNGYLHGPQNLLVEHSYDGVNHFALSWDPPLQAVTGYKIIVNYETEIELASSDLSYTVSTNEVAPYGSLTVIALKAVYEAGESDPVVLRMDSALSITDNVTAQIPVISMYPNPFKDVLNIEAKDLSGSTLELYNIKGQLVGSWSLSDNTRVVPDARLGSGIYYYRIKGQGHIQKGIVVRYK